MPRGGYRPNAGRKTDAEIERLRALTAQAISDETWITILKGLAEEAQYGNVRCAELLIHYAFGVSAAPTKPARPDPAPAVDRISNQQPSEIFDGLTTHNSAA